MSAFSDLLDFPEVTLPQPNFDSVEARHIAMASHDVECDASFDLARTCTCQPITWINGQPVYATKPYDGPRDWDADTSREMDYTERREMLANA